MLTHVLIYANRMQGGDGIITIDAPFECKLPPMAIPGQKFLNAVVACGGSPNLDVTDAGRLSVKKNSFKAFLTCLPGADFPCDTLTGDSHSVPVTLLTVLAKLRPFVSQDASRPWSMGMRFDAGYAYATNNVILARVPIDWDGPPLVLPRVAINALLELKELPGDVYLTDTSAAFTYNDNSWLKARMQVDGWPNVGAMLDKGDYTSLPVVPAGLLEAVQKVKRFCTNVKFPTIVLSEAGVSSDDGGGDIAAVDGLSLPESQYNADMLETVLTNATHADFSLYPAPCVFKGDGGLEGIFVGTKP